MRPILGKGCVHVWKPDDNVVEFSPSTLPGSAGTRGTRLERQASLHTEQKIKLSERVAGVSQDPETMSWHRGLVINSFISILFCVPRSLGPHPTSVSARRAACLPQARLVTPTPTGGGGGWMRQHPHNQHLHTCQGLIVGLSARASEVIWEQFLRLHSQRTSQEYEEPPGRPLPRPVCPPMKQSTPHQHFCQAGSSHIRDLDHFLCPQVPEQEACLLGE